MVCATSKAAYEQSDQRLCLLLNYSMTVKLVTEHHLAFLSLKRGCTGSSESTLVKMPHCWKPHVTAHIMFLESITCDPLHARIQRGGRESGPPPPEKSQKIGFLSSTGPDPLKNHKATKPEFTVRRLSARQRNAI